MTSKQSRWILLLVVNVLALIFVLALIEAGLRISHRIHVWWKRPAAGASMARIEPIDDFWGAQPKAVFIHQRSSIPGLDFEMAPNRELRAGNGVLIKTNQYGMRDDEPVTQKTNSPCRIAAVGDSYTFGLGVRSEEAYPKMLEKLLRRDSTAAACEFEVLNFGVVAYSSYDEDLMLKYRVVNFDPHAAIIGYVLNDPEIDPIQPLHRYFAGVSWWQHFRLFRLIDETKTDWDIRRLGGGDYYVYLHAKGQAKWQSVVDAFDDIREVASARNINIVVAIFPELTESFKGKPWADYPYRNIHRQVTELAVSKGFRVVDLLETFSKYPSRDVVFPGEDDHPSVLGHRIAAQAIEKELLSESSYFFGAK